MPHLPRFMIFHGRSDAGHCQWREALPVTVPVFVLRLQWAKVSEFCVWYVEQNSASDTFCQFQQMETLLALLLVCLPPISQG